MERPRTPRQFEAARGSMRGDRALNQDRSLFLSSGDTLLLGVADGLGGHPRGEAAAQLLIDAAESLFRRAQKPLLDPTRFLLQCVGRAHAAILRFGSRQSPPIAPRTTAVLAIVQHGIAYWAHVGDSRLYLVRDGNILVQTRDHTLVRFVRQAENEPSQPRASLSRCLGGMPQAPTTTCGTPVRLHRHDGLLLCSDGLWGQVPRQALIELFADGAIMQRLDALLRKASDLEGSDNVTAVALRWLADAGDAADKSIDDLELTPPDPQLDAAIAHLERVLKDQPEPN